jgi:hypothetical protein
VSLLNESQKRAILVAILDMHRRMAELEALLDQGESELAQHSNDVSETESDAVKERFRRLRALSLESLQELNIPLDIQRTSVRWALECAATYMDVVVTEMGPERLRSYGAVTSEDAARVKEIQGKLRQSIDEVLACLRQRGSAPA